MLALVLAVGIGFYLHKEFRSAGIDFYVHKECGSAEIGFYLHTECMGAMFMKMAVFQ